MTDKKELKENELEKELKEDELENVDGGYVFFDRYGSGKWQVIDDIHGGVRDYEYLSKEGIIHSKRGLGYYVSGKAREIILNLGRTQFFEKELPRLLERMLLLEIPTEQVLNAISMYQSLHSSGRL